MKSKRRTDHLTQLDKWSDPHLSIVRPYSPVYSRHSNRSVHFEVLILDRGDTYSVFFSTSSKSASVASSTPKSRVLRLHKLKVVLTNQQSAGCLPACPDLHADIGKQWICFVTRGALKNTKCEKTLRLGKGLCVGACIWHETSAPSSTPSQKKIKQGTI